MTTATAHRQHPYSAPAIPIFEPPDPYSVMSGALNLPTVEPITPTLRGPYGHPTDLPSPRVNGVWGDPRSGGRRQHQGLDMVDNVPANTTLGNATAIADGVVSRVGNHGSRGYGQFVEVTHVDGTRSRYAHVDGAPYVKEGDRVQTGDPLASLGTTGGSSGPHLHFEVLDKDGRKVDPQSLAVGYGIDDSPGRKLGGLTTPMGLEPDLVGSIFDYADAMDERVDLQPAPTPTPRPDVPSPLTSEADLLTYARSADPTPISPLFEDPLQGQGPAMPAPVALNESAIQATYNREQAAAASQAQLAAHQASLEAAHSPMAYAGGLTPGALHDAYAANQFEQASRHALQSGIVAPTTSMPVLDAALYSAARPELSAPEPLIDPTVHPSETQVYRPDLEIAYNPPPANSPPAQLASPRPDLLPEPAAPVPAPNPSIEIGSAVPVPAVMAPTAVPTPEIMRAMPVVAPQPAVSTPPTPSSPLFHDAVPGATQVPTTTITRTPEERTAAAHAVAAQTAPVVAPPTVAAPAPPPVASVAVSSEELPAQVVDPIPTSPLMEPAPTVPTVAAPPATPAAPTPSAPSIPALSTPAVADVPTSPLMQDLPASPPPAAPQPVAPAPAPVPAVMQSPAPQVQQTPTAPSIPTVAPPTGIATPAAPSSGSSIPTFQNQAEAIPHTNEAGFVPGLAPSIIADAKAKGITAPDGMLVGYSPIGGFAAVHPSKVSPASTGPGIFGMLGMDDTQFANGAARVPGRLAGAGLGGMAGAAVGGPVGGLLGSFFGGMFGGRASQAFVNNQAVAAGYGTPTASSSMSMGGGGSSSYGGGDYTAQADATYDGESKGGLW